MQVDLLLYMSFSKARVSIEDAAASAPSSVLHSLLVVVSVRSMILMPAFCILEANLVLTRSGPGVKTPPLPRRETIEARSSNRVRAACTRKMGVAIYPGSGPEISTLASLSGSLPAEAARPEKRGDISLQA